MPIFFLNVKFLVFFLHSNGNFPEGQVHCMFTCISIISRFYWEHLLYLLNNSMCKISNTQSTSVIFAFFNFTIIKSYFMNIFYLLALLNLNFNFSNDYSIPYLLNFILSNIFILCLVLVLISYLSNCTFIKIYFTFFPYWRNFLFI